MLCQELMNEASQDVFCLAFVVEAAVGKGDCCLGLVFYPCPQPLDDKGPGDVSVIGVQERLISDDTHARTVFPAPAEVYHAQ